MIRLHCFSKKNSGMAIKILGGICGIKIIFARFGCIDFLFPDGVADNLQDSPPQFSLRHQFYANRKIFLYFFF